MNAQLLISVTVLRILVQVTPGEKRWLGGRGPFCALFDTIPGAGLLNLKPRRF